VSFRVAIPARYGSTRLPGKPLIALAGCSMLEHVYRRALASGAAEVVIATDDERIVEAARGFGAEVSLTDPAHGSGSDRIAELAAQRGWGDDEIVVNLQGDEPSTPAPNVARVAEDLAAHPEASIATLCTPIGNARELFDPHAVKVVRDAAGLALYFSRSAIPWERDALQLETTPDTAHCLRHIGLYAYRVGYLKQFTALEPSPLERLERLEQLRALWHGARIYVGLAPERPGPGVDTPDDVATVEAWLLANPGP
jgi:3-deoxy-manno-octulosonate cytidylyltransferase (CMP-KDO synthetase)